MEGGAEGGAADLVTVATLTADVLTMARGGGGVMAGLLKRYSLSLCLLWPYTLWPYLLWLCLVKG